MTADFKDYYDILGIEFGASQDDIKRAWKRKMRQYHPDKFANADEEGRKRANEMAKLANEAYQTLKDEEERRRYDHIYRIKKGIFKPEEAVVSGGGQQAVYAGGAIKGGAVYSGTVRRTAVHATPITPSYGKEHVYDAIDVDGEEVEVITKPIDVGAEGVEAKPLKTSKPVRYMGRKDVGERDMAFVNGAIAVTIAAILIVIFVFPYLIPNYPNLINIASEALGNSHSPKDEDVDGDGVVDTDMDGVPDDMDIYPEGDGAVVVKVTYFHVVSMGESDESINPVFRFYLNNGNVTTIPYYGLTDYDSEGNESIMQVFNIADDTTRITVALEVLNYMASSESDEVIDIDERPYMTYPTETYSFSDMSNGLHKIIIGDGSTDGNDGEIDATIIYSISIVDIMDVWG